MDHHQRSESKFFEQTDLDINRIQMLVDEALNGVDDGELFLEYCSSESLSYDDGRLKGASFNTSRGFGLRTVSGESSGYAHSSELSEDAIRRAATAVKAVHAGHRGTLSLNPPLTNRNFYSDENPISNISFDSKVKLLADIDTYARSKDSRVRQVSTSLSGSLQEVEVLRSNGYRITDVRPLVRLNVSIVVGERERQESGSHGVGGRTAYEAYIHPKNWKPQVDEALRQALINLESRPAPAGEMTVVLGPGWPGILLHEAIGHGLEGDFNRKKTSTFSGLMGERIAAPGITVIDDGTIEKRRGSLSVDDEGTPTERTVLIDDGILVGFLQDRLNSRLMGMAPTGNGRRESYEHAPMPRMTNTFMLGGSLSPEEVIESVQKGLYATNFGGGQVDITSGKFVFTCTEAYLIENGRIGAPVKGASLIGSGPEVLTKVGAIADDMKLDPGIGTCGKDGQGVPVGVGLPTIRIDGITVGGTDSG